MKSRGFTLIELLVVVVIIGILIGMLLPAVQYVREAGRRTNCLNNIRQLALAALNYESANQHLPNGITPIDATPFGATTWLAQLLPHIEQQAVWERAKLDYRQDPVPFLSHQGLRTPIALFACPSDPTSGIVQLTHGNRFVACTNYVGVNGTNFREEDGVFFLNSNTRFADITDGQSNTLMIGERPPSNDFWYGWWYAGAGQDGSGSPDLVLGVAELNATPPAGRTTFLESCAPGPFQYEKGREEQCDALHFWSFHPNGANFAWADGSARLLPYSIDPTVLAAMATRRGQEITESP